MKDKKILLTPEQIEYKIQRLSNEVAEKYVNKKELFVFGIKDEGYLLAERIVKETKKLIDINMTLHPIIIDKQNPIKNTVVDQIILNKIKNKNVLIVDDVLNSGKTLFYAMQPFVELPLESLRVLVLVNRSHQKYPVFPEFVGMSLSTTFQNHIEADLKNKTTSHVYLLHK